MSIMFCPPAWLHYRTDFSQRGQLAGDLLKKFSVCKNPRGARLPASFIEAVLCVTGIILCNICSSAVPAVCQCSESALIQIVIDFIHIVDSSLDKAFYDEIPLAAVGKRESRPADQFLRFLQG